MRRSEGSARSRPPVAVSMMATITPPIQGHPGDDDDVDSGKREHAEYVPLTREERESGNGCDHGQTKYGRHYESHVDPLTHARSHLFPAGAPEQTLRPPEQHGEQHDQCNRILVRG